MKENRTNKQQN